MEYVTRMVQDTQMVLDQAEVMAMYITKENGWYTPNHLTLLRAQGYLAEAIQVFNALNEKLKQEELNGQEVTR